MGNVSKGLADQANDLKAANPKWTWKRIAAELGVSERTLRRARDTRPAGYLDQYQGDHLVKLPFHGGHVLTLDQGGKPHVLLKPAFDHMGLASDHYIRKLQDQPWAQGRTSVTRVRVSDRQTTQGQYQDMITADVRTFLMLLAIIPASRVSEAARPMVIAYQNEVADVLESYWTKGGAINPRASEPQLVALEEKIGDVREARMREVLHSRNVRDIIAAAADYAVMSDDDKRRMFAGLRDRIHKACTDRTAKQLIAERQIQRYTGKREPTKADRANAMNYLLEHELEDEDTIAVDMTVELRYLVRRGGSYTVAEAFAALGKALDRMRAAGLRNPFA